VLDFTRRGTQEEISEEAVAVGAHGDQVAPFVFDPLDDLIGGFSVGEFRIGVNSFGLQFGLDFLQVGGVFDDFAADGVGTVSTSGPTVGDVEQNNAAVREFGQVLYVFDDGAVGGGAIDGEQDFVVHGTFMYSAWGRVSSVKSCFGFESPQGRLSGRRTQDVVAGGNYLGSKPMVSEMAFLQRLMIRTLQKSAG